MWNPTKILGKNDEISHIRNSLTKAWVFWIVYVFPVCCAFQDPPQMEDKVADGGSLRKHYYWFLSPLVPPSTEIFPPTPTPPSPHAILKVRLWTPLKVGPVALALLPVPFTAAGFAHSSSLQQNILVPQLCPGCYTPRSLCSVRCAAGCVLAVRVWVVLVCLWSVLLDFNNLPVKVPCYSVRNTNWYWNGPCNHQWIITLGGKLWAEKVSK